MSVDIGVHLYPNTPMRHIPFPATSTGGPFVSVKIGASGHEVTLLVTDPAALTNLITVAVAARGDLEALTDHAAPAA